jgi:signal peptide peptidase SppA
MKYPRLLMAVAAEFWAMEETKLAAVTDFLIAQANGEKLTAEAIEARIGPRTEAAQPATREGAVAVMRLHGVVANRMNLMTDVSGGTSSELFGRQFQALVADKDVSAIVLDVNSPGGAAAGTDELSTLIRGARGAKPIIAQVDSVAASAAYWIASAADEIVLTPSGEVGSIGVLSVHDDISAALEQQGVKKTIIAVPPSKADGSPFGPLSDDERAHRLQRAEQVYDRFVSTLAANRGVPAEVVRKEWGGGRMRFADEAIRLGMADRVGTMAETLARLTAGAGQPRPAFAREREKRALALRG